MNCSLSGSSVLGNFQARILEWATIASSRGSSWPRDQTHISGISCIAGRFFTHWVTWEAPPRSFTNRKTLGPHPQSLILSVQGGAWATLFFFQFCRWLSWTAKAAKSSVKTHRFKVIWVLAYKTNTQIQNSRSVRGVWLGFCSINPQWFLGFYWSVRSTIWHLFPCLLALFSQFFSCWKGQPSG